MAEDSISFITDKNGRRTHAVVPIDVYDQLLALKGLLKPTAKLGEHEIYTFSTQDAVARGYPDGSRSKPDFMILKGSQAALMEVGSVPSHIQKLREELLSDMTLELDPVNSCFVFTQDLRLNSPSKAAALVAGNVRNGLDVWINREGFSLKESGYGTRHRKRQQSK